MLFLKRNFEFFKLAIISNLEYRINFSTDVIIQPALTAGIEILLWISIFATTESQLIGGFNRESYLVYYLWAAFMARIAVSWMYEFRMIEEVDSGTINGILVRPISFYEYYLSQLMGYKFITTVFSLMVPLSITYFGHFAIHYQRLPIALLLLSFYMIFVHTVSFFISTLAFRLNRVYSLTGAKNLALWLFTGELIPLDLLPETIKNIFIKLPFCSGVYLPVGFVTGRVSGEDFYFGFISVAIGILIMAAISKYSWATGLRKYSGTGA